LEVGAVLVDSETKAGVEFALKDFLGQWGFVATTLSEADGRQVQKNIEQRLAQSKLEHAIALKIDTGEKTVYAYIDGQPVSKTPTEPIFRFVDEFAVRQIDIFSSESGYIWFPRRISNICVSRWSGVLRETASPPCTIFENGDVIQGTPDSMNKSGFRIQTAAGSIEATLERLGEILFAPAGDLPAPQKTHVRMADGTLLYLESFYCDATGLSGRNSILGDIKLPFQHVSELDFASALQPADTRRTERRKLAHETRAEAGQIGEGMNALVKKESVATGTIATPEQLRNYVPRNSPLWKSLGEAEPKDPLGNPLGIFKVGAEYQVDPATITALEDVAPASYWEH
jgi:hypothetical protein